MNKKAFISLSLDGPPHNYLVTDERAKQFLVSQNSHSVSYAILTYHTAYVKTYWPHIFIAASMIDAIESKSGDDLENTLRDFMKECKQLKIKLSPPRINISGTMFTPYEDDDKVRHIMFGLTSVRKVGLNSASVIVKNREDNGPYKSVQDIVVRGTARKDGMINLIKIGAFDGIPLLDNSDVVLTRKALLYAYRKIHEWNAKNKARLKNKKAESREPLPLDLDIDELVIIGEFSKAELSSMEFEILGVYISGGILDAYNIPAGAHNPTESRQIGKVQGQYVGLVSSRRSFISRKGTPYLVFEISDGITHLPCIYFYDEDDEKDIASLGLLVNNNPVCIEGKVSNRGTIVIKKVFELEQLEVKEPS